MSMFTLGTMAKACVILKTPPRPGTWQRIPNTRVDWADGLDNETTPRLWLEKASAKKGDLAQLKIQNWF